MTVAPRAPLPGPPPGFRPHMSMRVQRDAALILNGLDPSNVEWHHSPPLQSRLWDSDKLDTIPPANDPHFIVPMAREDHKARTAKTDIPEIAKTKRLSKEQEKARVRMLAKGEHEPVSKERKRKIPSRPFQKRRSKDNAA